MEESKPFAKFKKCEFWHDRVSFLRHVVSKDGISIDLSEVEVMVRWKRLTIVTKVRSFRIRYYRGFIKGFSKIALSLTKPRRKLFIV